MNPASDPPEEAPRRTPPPPPPPKEPPPSQLRPHALKRRIRGLTKKSYELATLCDVELCMICYGPGAGGQLEVWPANPSAVKRTIERFDQVKNTGKVKQMLGLEDPVDSKKRMRNQELACKHRGNCQVPRYYSWHPELDKCSEELLRDLILKLDGKLLMVKERINQQDSKKSIKKRGLSTAKPSGRPDRGTTSHAALANGGSNGGSTTRIIASNDNVGNGNGDVGGGAVVQSSPSSLFNGTHGLFGTELDCVHRWPPTPSGGWQ